MTTLADFEADAVQAYIDSIPDDEFLEILNAALTKDPSSEDFDLATGYPCFFTRD